MLTFVIAALVLAALVLIAGTYTRESLFLICVLALVLATWFETLRCSN